MEGWLIEGISNWKRQLLKKDWLLRWKEKVVQKKYLEVHKFNQCARNK